MDFFGNEKGEGERSSGIDTGTRIEVPIENAKRLAS
jgi:hypothetical protein